MCMFVQTLNLPGIAYKLKKKHAVRGTDKLFAGEKKNQAAIQLLFFH